MLGAQVPGGGVSVAGTFIADETLLALTTVAPESILSRPAPRALLAESRSRDVDAGLVQRLRELAVAVEKVDVEGTDTALGRPTEYAVVPVAAVETIAGWVAGLGEPSGHAFSVGSSRAATRADAVFAWRGSLLTEEAVTVGPDRLAAIRTTPPECAGRPGTPVVVWLNSGSEHHVGPGRAWVEFGRDLALDGWTSLRIDMTGWGESPDASHAPGRPYDPHTLAETERIIGSLSASGARVVLAGLCAGAWVALRVAATTTGPAPAGVVAINPQMYWQPGDPVEANIASETRVRRQSEITRWKRLSKTGIWSALDACGVRHPASVWLGELRRRAVPALLLFAESDDGLEFLNDRVGRAFRASQRRCVLVREMQGVDHGLHRMWKRDEVTRAVARWLQDEFNSSTARSLRDE